MRERTNNRLIIQEIPGGRISVALHWSGDVVAEPAGKPVVFEHALDASAREDLRWYLEQYLDEGVYEERGIVIQQHIPAWGEALFQAVFGESSARSVYDKALRSQPTELVLQSNSADFLGLPWELLKDPARKKPLVCDFAGLSRVIPVSGPAFAPAGDNLRILMIISRPGGLEDVAYRTIARPLVEKLEEVSGSVQLDVLRPPTFDALKEKVKAAAAAKRPYHIVHFDGHGDFRHSSVAGSQSESQQSAEKKCNNGYLLFERSQGGQHLVPSKDFASAMREGKVPLVVLNACKSGTLKDTINATIATCLMQKGIAAVIAMGYSIYVSAAADFMKTFYNALLGGEFVSSAVAAGRQYLYVHRERRSLKGPLPFEDWMVPVHYMRREVIFPAFRRTVRTRLPPWEDLLKRFKESPESGEMLTPRTPRFVGRDDAFYILELALHWQRVVVVHGIGGIGKTELAKAFGRWWRATGGLDNPNWLFFFSFEPGRAPTSLDALISEVLKRIYGDDFLAKTEGPAQRRSIVLYLLQRNRMLLVWDNFETVHSMPDPTSATRPLPPEQLHTMLEFIDTVAATGKTGLIITSRNEEAWLGGVRRLELGGLRQNEAAEFADDLLAPYPRARARREDKAYGELLKWLDGHPRSLRNIVPYLESMPPAKLLAALRGETVLPPELQSEAGRHRSLIASVKYSIDHLNVATQRLLLALPLFGRVINESVLMHFSSSGVLPERFAGIPPSQWSSAMHEAARVGLLEPLGNGSYRLPPDLLTYLTVQWRAEAADRFEEEYQAAKSALAGTYFLRSGWLYDQIEDAQSRSKYQMAPESPFHTKISVQWRPTIRRQYSAFD